MSDARIGTTNASPPMKGPKRIMKLPTGGVKLTARETTAAKPLMKDAPSAYRGAMEPGVYRSRGV